jgi:hypothetical protein
MNRPILTTAAVLAAGSLNAADPRIDSWFTGDSSRYARVYATPAALVSRSAVTTWSNGTQTQALPAYSGVQELSASEDWVYLRTTGLGGHTMGPWANGNFPNLPTNRKVLYRIPRHPTAPATKTLTGLGSIGYFVDGVAMFDSRDAFVWNGTAEVGGGAGYWNREAYVNESATFDPAFAHQENTGTYHYHASPVALRHRLGDHVEFNAATQTYRESTNAVTRHSPILGWVRDGFPVYGPYGYSNATNAASGLRRMLSGFQLRNGQRGTDNLAATGRSTIPAWAQRLYGVTANQSGPAVSAQYPLGRYMEDNAYLGDLANPATGSAHVQGTDFDLDVYNGRWCVTPEFPEGTYAYFVSIASDGTPVYPYNIGRAYYGNPTGSAVTAIAETVIRHFVGGAEAPANLGVPATGASGVTLVWSAVEGGSYQVESSTNLTLWSSLASPVAVQGVQGTLTTPATHPQGFFRVRQTGVATYDPATGTPTGGGGGNGGGPVGPPLTSVSPVSGVRGSTVTVTFNLGGNPPPAGLTPTAVTLGTVSGTAIRRTGTTVVNASFALPAAAAPGALDATVVFPGPPGMGEVRFALAGAFTLR